MTKKEALRIRIEEERVKLIALAAKGIGEDAYRQSRVVDRLMEEYLELCK